MSSWTWVHSQDSVEAAKETPRLIISFHTISLILSWKPFQLAQKNQRWKEPSPFELKETSLGTEVKHDQNSLGREATSEQALESDSRKKFIRGGYESWIPVGKSATYVRSLNAEKILTEVHSAYQ